MTSGDKARKREQAIPELHTKEALLCLSMFFHRYIGTIYGNEDLDLVSICLLNEIAQHNLEPFAREGLAGFPRNAEEMKLMQGCNAFSLSQSTGVPRETVRRKIKQLVKLGWIEQHNRKGLFIAMQWIDRLAPEESPKLLADFKTTAARIGKLLEH